MKAGSRLVYFVLLTFISAVATAQVPVQVEAVSARTIVEQVNVTGTVTSPRTAVLSSSVAGLVTDIAVDEGRRVKKGEAILQLDAELPRLALQRSKVEVRQRETVLADAQRRFAEAQSVGPERGVAQTRIDSLSAEVASAEAALAVARIAVREQAALLARHKVNAPFAGVIRERFTELGEWVSPGDGLFELVAMDDLRFDFRVSQNFFGNIKEDTAVEITLDSLPDQTLSGKISAIVPIKDPGSRTFLVRTLANANEAIESLAISPGMSASARFSLDTGRTGTAVSRDSIVRYPDGRMTVWIVKTVDGLPTVSEQAVRSGVEFDGFIEIKEGLADGDRVVSRGNESLQNDQIVNILDSGS